VSGALPRAASQRDRWLLLGLVAIAVLGLSIWAHLVNGAMPLVLDEAVYLWQAEQLASGHLTGPAPQYPEFVSVTFLPVRDGRRFGQYPIGYPLALVPWVLLGIPWASNPILGGITLILFHYFVRSLHGTRTAWLATALMAASPFFIIQSGAFFSHPLLLALTMLALFALEHRERSPRRALWALVCGAAVAYSVNVSPFSAIALVPVVLHRVLATRKATPPSPREALAFAAPLLVGAVAFAAVNAVETGSPWVPAYYYSSAEVRAGFGEEVGSKRGYSPSDALALTKNRLRELGKYLFGWPISSFSAAACYLGVRIARRLRRRGARDARESDPREQRAEGWDATLVILLVSTLVVFAFWYFHGNGPSWGPRYLYTTIPVVILFTARGLEVIGEWCSRLVARAAPTRDHVARLMPWALAGLLFALGAPSFLERIAGQGVPQSRRGARALLESIRRDGIDRATIFVRSHGTKSMFRQDAILSLSAFSEDAPVVFARDRGTRLNEEFVAHRGGGPIYRVRLYDESFDWRIEPYVDRSVRFGRGSKPDTMEAR
jgi:hypothetical protein